MFSNVLKKITRLFSNTLYYPGCLTHFVLPEIEANYVKILKTLGIEHLMIQEVVCCGSPVRAAGYTNEFIELKNHHESVLKGYGIGKIIFNCPSCYSTFNRFYGEEFEYVHITSLINQHIGRIGSIYNGKVATYHDPCHLGRYESIYEEPRNIIKKLGFKLVEMEDHGENAMCCGAGGGLRNNKKAIAKRIGKERIKQALDTGADVLITTCPLCYLHLKECAAGKIEVKEISEVIIDAIKS